MMKYRFPTYLSLEKELYDLISYDEWSAREFGEKIVDYYDGTENLTKGAFFENAFSDEASVLTL